MSDRNALSEKFNIYFQNVNQNLNIHSNEIRCFHAKYLFGIDLSKKPTYYKVNKAYRALKILKPPLHKIQKLVRCRYCAKYIYYNNLAYRQSLLKSWNLELSFCNCWWLFKLYHRFSIYESENIIKYIKCHS